MPTPDPNCKHYWIIDQANHGVCKYCGLAKDFPGIGDIQDFNWRTKRTADEDPVEGGTDMADKSPLAGLELEEARVRVAQQPDVKLKSKRKTGHDKVPCTWPDCDEMVDPRYVHLHILRIHKGLLPRLKPTPQHIVDKILKWSDAGMRQSDILIKLQKEEGETLTGTRLQTLLNRERPDRVKWRRNKRQATLTLGSGILSGPADQKPEKVDRNVDQPANRPKKQTDQKVDRQLTPEALLRSVLRLIVDGASPEDIADKALDVKGRLTTIAKALTSQIRLADELIEYAGTLGANSGED